MWSNITIFGWKGEAIIISKKTIFLIFLILTVVFVSGEEIWELSLSIAPGAVWSVGDSISSFLTSSGVGLSADFRLKSFPLFFLKLDSYYTYLPLQTLDDGVNDDSGSAGGNIALKGGVIASYAVSPSFSIFGDLYYLHDFYLNQGIGLSGGV